ncbi:MAG: beta-ketoacyl synthase chain length factor [Bacteroidales bacterium]|nr:beta-ketoacyl synthase chain length factor [Bacteroidales bacterium]
MNKVYVTAIVKDVPLEEYGQYLPPMKARRMGKLQKRALVTALKAMEASGIMMPDAIINGTAMGCMENTVQMLDGLMKEGEQMNMPTCFMQSTHNTVASMIAIYTKNHGYNTTYSHRTISFELALQDALLRLRTGLLRTALVCVNDELTELQQQQPRFFGQLEVLDRSEAWMLSVEPGDHPIYEIENVKIIHQKGMEDRAVIQKISL